MHFLFICVCGFASVQFDTFALLVWDFRQEYFGGRKKKKDEDLCFAC